MTTTWRDILGPELAEEAIRRGLAAPPPGPDLAAALTALLTPRPDAVPTPAPTVTASPPVVPIRPAA